MKISCLSILTFFLVSCSPIAHGRVQDGLSLRGARNFWSGYPATSGELVNVVVEIPAGSNAKWEVDKSDGSLRWEIRDGKPRVVQYLAYPANYGMIPRTLLPKELGGDGDPLDVFLLGPAQPRGSLVPARLLGVLQLLDGGEQDDKLIALAVDAPMPGVSSLAELDEKYPGVSRILEIFMTGYKGPGEIESRGYSGREKARAVLDSAMQAYEIRIRGQ